MLTPSCRLRVQKFQPHWFSMLIKFYSAGSKQINRIIFHLISLEAAGLGILPAKPANAIPLPSSQQKVSSLPSYLPVPQSLPQGSHSYLLTSVPGRFSHSASWTRYLSPHQGLNSEGARAMLTHDLSPGPGIELVPN